MILSLSKQLDFLNPLVPGFLNLRQISKNIIIRYFRILIFGIEKEFYYKKK